MMGSYTACIATKKQNALFVYMIPRLFEQCTVHAALQTPIPELCMLVLFYQKILYQLIKYLCIGAFRSFFFFQMHCSVHRILCGRISIFSNLKRSAHNSAINLTFI